MALISVHNLSLLESEERVPPATGVVCIKHRRRSYSRCCRSRGLNPLVKALPVPFPWDACAAVAVVRGACTPSSVVYPTRQALTRCHCFIASDLDPFPPETSPTFPQVAFGTAAAVRCTRHLPAKVVCNDAAGRSFLFTSCRHLSARNRNRLPVASSLSTSRDAYAAADGLRGACTTSSVAYSDSPDAHPVFTICHCIRARSLYPIPSGSFVPTMRDAYAAAA